MGKRQATQPVPLKLRFRAFLSVSSMRTASALPYSARIRAAQDSRIYARHHQVVSPGNTLNVPLRVTVSTVHTNIDDVNAALSGTDIQSAAPKGKAVRNTGYR